MPVWDWSRGKYRATVLYLAPRSMLDELMRAGSAWCAVLMTLTATGAVGSSLVAAEYQGLASISLSA